MLIKMNACAGILIFSAVFEGIFSWNIFDAIESGDKEKVRKALKPGKLKAPFIKSKRKTGKIIDGFHPALGVTPLIYAIQLRKEDIAIFLIENGADMTLTRSDPPWYMAAAHDLGNLVMLMLDKGANLNGNELQERAYLYWSIKNAIRKGEDEEVANLLRIKALITYAYDMVYNSSPLSLAIMMEMEDVAIYLINKGADVEEGYGGVEPPLRLAIRSEMEKVVELIVAKGVDLRKVIFRGWTYLHLAVMEAKNVNIVRCLCDKKENLDLDAVDQSGCTPLQEALIHNSDAEIIRALINAGANVNALTPNEETALHLAAGFDGNNEEILNLLLEIEDVRNSQLEARNKFGFTPLLRASSNEGSLRALLNAGANVHAEENSRSILHRVSCCRKGKIIKLVQSYGYDVDCKNEDGDTPFLLAFQSEDLRAMTCLLKAGADIDARNHAGKTALHYSAKLGLPVHFAELLLFHGADLNAVSSREITIYWNVSVMMSTGTYGVNAGNAWLEAGINVSEEDLAEFLKLNWPTCYEVVKNGKFANFQEFLLKVVEKYEYSQISHPLLESEISYPSGKFETVASLYERYEHDGVFGFYKILKGICDKKEPAMELERMKMEIFDGAVGEIAERTYLRTIPLDLSVDIFLTSAFYAWKLEKMAFNLALAAHQLNVSLDDAKREVNGIIYSESFAPRLPNPYD